ncbi:MAG: putative DNA binding domain-containing protein [Anaerolineales bacterium]|nr:putative DNA binding domain-containing protein [Anaerolineales bacterium]
MSKKRTHAQMMWRTIDVHMHTPASSDYQQPEASYLDILQRAEMRGLDIIAFTDHNTVAGYRGLLEEIEQLTLLERLHRILPDEQARLNEYRRLMEKILILPGIEFTATFGFHILGIFPPQTPVREIEHLLLDLNIPPEQLDDGSATVGATSDVLTAYRMLDEAGGLVIAAHANSSNGVAMRGFPIGGQTKIAYTQDPHLHALEVTDLEQRGSRTTAAFFTGTKPEYPRRMHCIQSSDAHRVATDPQRKKNIGVGDRATDVLLPEVSFEALKELFLSNDFSRTRPHRHKEEPAYDFIRTAREEGANLVQDFHESMTVRGGKLYAMIADVCAFANTNGGTLYIGLSSDPRKPVVGISGPDQAITQLEKEIRTRITPPLPVAIDAHETGGKKILRVLIPRGEDPPYAVDDNKIYVRDEAETGLAVRDEIFGLVMRGTRAQAPAPVLLELPAELPSEVITQAVIDVAPPRTGVEIVRVEEGEDERYYTMRDLRNGNQVKNVTRKSARRLWHYAITEHAKLPADPAQARVHWNGDIGLLNQQKQGQNVRYDLVQRTDQGLRFYFGVTDDGIHGPWKALVGSEED